jgi:hypothetical protein
MEKEAELILTKKLNEYLNQCREENLFEVVSTDLDKKKFTVTFNIDYDEENRHIGFNWY